MDWMNGEIDRWMERGLGWMDGWMLMLQLLSSYNPSIKKSDTDVLLLTTPTAIAHLIYTRIQSSIH
jgi:hypothetical protein